MSRRRVAVFLSTRGNYAKMKSTMRAIRARADLELLVISADPLTSPRYGDFRPTLERDGFPPVANCDYLAEGETPSAMLKSLGQATLRSGELVEALRPDVILVIADRYEALAFATTALCLNVAVAHLEGGEVSGSIDERIRHAITKLAHLHFVANAAAAERVIRMGESADTVFVVGSPSLDVVTEINLADKRAVTEYLSHAGRGAPVDLSQPYLVVSQHPVVTEYDDTPRQITETLRAVASLGIPTIWILPNLDAGYDHVTGVLQSRQTHSAQAPIRFVASLPFELYAPLLVGAKCLLGNTSSGIRESAYLGVPVVNIGTRQTGRQRGVNVVDVGYQSDAIAAAARAQMAHGPYPSDAIYGDGRAGERIAVALATAALRLDKTITY